MAQPPLLGIHEAALYVDDLDDTARFWQRLGFAIVGRRAGRHVFVRVGDDMLLLFNAEATRRGGTTPPHGAVGPGHVAFAVPDHDALDAWRARLGDDDIPIETVTEWPSGGRSLYFRDPSGNSIELITASAWGRVG